MSVSSANSFSVSQQQQTVPVKENNTAARTGEECCAVTTVALVVLGIIGCLVAGITLTTIGAVTANPVFLDIGICLLVGSILGLIKGCCLASCRS